MCVECVCVCVCLCVVCVECGVCVGVGVGVCVCPPSSTCLNMFQLCREPQGKWCSLWWIVYLSEEAVISTQVSSVT